MADDLQTSSSAEPTGDPSADPQPSGGEDRSEGRSEGRSGGRGEARGDGRAPRQGGNRELGGFRIRLSDNEMQAARALQEAFGLRSTVAVLGFSLRTLAQQLEAGQLDDLVAQQRSQAGSRGPGSAPRGGGRGGERRGDRHDGGGSGGGAGGGGGRGPRIDPFARPSRPAAPVSTSAAETSAAETSASQSSPPEGELELTSLSPGPETDTSASPEA